MAKILMYSTRFCPYCVRAEQLLHSKGVNIDEKIMIDQDHEQMRIMMERSKRRTVPQIFIDDYHVGGFDDLKALDEAGDLEPLLAK